jgi:general stress protein YciG
VTSTSVNEAGRRGGLTVLQKRGRGFYADIGHKGQLALRLKYPNMASEWGKLGGRPRKPSLSQLVGENSK